MKPTFATMTKSELKAYLLEHRNDLEAFHALMDKINSETEPKFYSPEDANQLLKILNQHKST
jgi:hypothetical protein